MHITKVIACTDSKKVKVAASPKIVPIPTESRHKRIGLSVLKTNEKSAKRRRTDTMLKF